MGKSLIEELHQRLYDQADPAVKVWWEGYVKDSAPFLGVKMPAIRTTLHQWHKEFIAVKLPPDGQLDLALALFDRPHTEEKLAGTLFLQEILLPAGVLRCGRDLGRFADLFARGKIFDWNICDWFCVKVLANLVVSEDLFCAERISAWRRAEDLWQARASLVTFVNLTANREFHPLIAESCRTLIRRKERFAKTAVGWVLREVSGVNEPLVRQLIEENARFFSTESLRNATKRMGKDTQARYRQLLKNYQA